MANWEEYKDYVKSVGNAKINFIDPNEINISSKVNGVARSVKETTKEWNKPIPHTWCAEDYCIDVDLTLEVPNREDSATQNQFFLIKWNGSGNTISIQSGHRFYYGENNADDNSMLEENERKPHINYLSTRDMEMTYYDVAEDNISTEMLGLNSVEISYETMFCPVVKMQFTDVHGIALFAPMERNHTNMVNGMAGISRNDIASSFYRALFNLPYPKATLRVKGLYGAPTIYELTFKNVSTSFDNSNGGFKINVELMGYIYSFLSEVPVLHSMIAPSSEYYGKSFWKNHKTLDKYKLDGGVEPLTWFEMIKKITDAKGKIQEEENNASANDTDIKRAKYNSQYIKQIEDLISAQRVALNACADYIQSAFREGECVVSTGDGYIAIGYNDPSNRLIVETMITDRNNITKDCVMANSKEELYNSFISSLKIVESLNEELRTSPKMVQNKLGFGRFTSFQRTENGEWSKNRGNILDTTTFADFNDKVGNFVSNKELSKFQDIFPNCNCVVLIFYGQETENNSYINSINTNRHFIKKLSAEQASLDDKAELQRTQIVQESLGFKPTLRNIMKTIMFHCETYFNMVQECAKEARALSQKRKASELGFEMSVSDFKTDIVPPFPEFCEKQNDKWVQSWIGNIKHAGIEPERKFVDAMFNAVENGEREMEFVADKLNTTTELVDEEIPFVGGSYSTPLMRYAIIPSDIMGGGYAFNSMNQSDFDSFIKDGNASALLSILYLRAMNLFGMKSPNSVKYNVNKFSLDLNNADNIKEIAEMDAWNFFHQFKKQGFMTTDLANKLEQVLVNDDLATEISNVIEGKGHIDLDKNKELLQTTYANEKGCDSLKLEIPSNCHIIDGGFGVGSLEHTNNLYKEGKFSLQKLYDTSVIVDNTMLNSVSIKYPSNLKDISANGYLGLKNYIVIDENMTLCRSQALKRVSDSKYINALNPLSNLVKYSIVDDYKVEGDYINYYSNVYDKGSGTKKANVDTSFECVNLFSEKIERSENHGDCNDKELFRNENAFCSVFYYGIRNSDAHLQDIQRAIYILIAEHDEVKRNGKYLDHYITYTFNRTNYDFTFTSKLNMLQLGALCFAHFFLDNTLYECFSDVNNYWCNHQYSSLNSQGRKINYISSRWYVRGVENNIKNYAMALYFYKWIQEEWKTVRDAFEFKEISDAESFYTIMHGLCSDPSKVKNIPSGYEKSGWEDESYGLEQKATVGYEQILNQMFMKNVFVMECLYEQNKFKFDIVFNQYLTQMLNNIKNAIRENDKTEQDVQSQKEQEANNIVTPIDESKVPIDPKISIYQATKRLWDKWLSGLPTNPITMDFFNKHFHFIDTFYNEIGDDIIINVTYLAETFARVTSQRQNWNLLSYIQEILRKSDIQFHNIQNWADLGNTDTMAKAFIPMSYIESHNMYPNDTYTSSISNTDFVCIYSYEPSHRLNNGDNNQDPNASDTTDDSFTISYDDHLNDLPSLMGRGMGSEFKIPAFAVTYAKQYQSYFTNIQVDSNAGMQTEWSIGATLNIAKQGSDKASEALEYYGQDIYTIYSNQSFTCKVEMVGCAWVQPLMYFVLTNIPMYRGTYMIYKVTHSISGGQMKTYFEGYRISKIGNRLVDADSCNQKNASAISSEPSLRILKASLNNDCGYTFHNPIRQEQTEFNVDYESTWNVEALKQYKPSYITKRTNSDGSERWDNMWDAICGTLYREYCYVDTEGKITALSMLNLHAVCIKRYSKAFQKTRLSGREKVGGIFRGAWEQIIRQFFVGQFKKCTNAQFIAMVEEVFRNPIKSILGNATEMTLEVPNVEFAYRIKPYPYPKDITRGKFRLPNITAYKYNKPNGTVKSATQNINKHTLRTIGRYSAPWEYAGHICGHHWDAMYYFTVSSKPVWTHLYSDTDMKGEVWTDEDFSIWSQAPNSTSQISYSEVDDNFVTNFIKCVQLSINETEEFGHTKVKVVKTLDSNSINAKDVGEGIVLMTCENREKNAMLFDMLCLGESKGYYGWWEKLVWISDSKSNENPKYILVALRKNMGNDFKAQIFLHTLKPSELNESGRLTYDMVNNLCKSNFVWLSQNGADLYSIPNNFYKVMAKSVPVDADVDKHQMLQTFSYAFGGTAYIKQFFGSVANERNIAYYLDKNKALSCVQTISETNEGNVELVKDVVSVPINETFAEMFPNSTTLRCSPTDKLRTFVGPVEYNQNITSDFKARTNPITKRAENHKAIDFTSATIPYGGNAVAGYDGKVVGIFLGRGYGYVVVIAYNIQNENGDLLVCAYPHFKQNTIKVKVGQYVKAGDIIAPLGKEGLATGIHSHFFIAFYKAENGKFKWDGRYGPNNELLKPINPHNYIEFQHVVNKPS